MADDRVGALLDQVRDTLPPVLFREWCPEIKILQTGDRTFTITVPGQGRIDGFRRYVEPFFYAAAKELGIKHTQFTYLASETQKSVPNTAFFAAINRLHADVKVQNDAEVKTQEDPPRTAGTSETPASAHSPMRVVYAEGNLTRWPFALTTDRSSDSVKEISFETSLRTPNGEIFRKWTATPGASGIPGPIDLNVFRALETFALENTIRKGRFLEGFVFFHIATIIKLLGLFYNNKNVTRVAKAFDRLQELSIEELGCWRSPTGNRKGRRPKASAKKGKIHLIDTIKAAGSVSSPGKAGAIDGTYAVRFSSEYESSVNDGYVRPLDWDLWSSLERPTSRRLMEILDMDFYGLRNAPYKPYLLSDLAALLPVTMGRYLSDSVKTFERAHQELRKHEYLIVELDKSDIKFPRFLYRPGRRWIAFQEYLGHRGELSEEAKNLASELGEPARASFYQRVLKRAPVELVNEALKDMRSLQRKPDNRAAWFLGALKAILRVRGIDLFPL